MCKKKWNFNSCCIRMSLKNIMLRERSQTQKSHIGRFHLIIMPQIGKSIETENRLVVATDE